MNNCDADKIETTAGGIGFLQLLTLLFIALKLTNYIDWSWLWVLAPLWIPLGLFIAALIGVIIVAIVAISLDHFKEKRLQGIILKRKDFRSDKKKRGHWPR